LADTFPARHAGGSVHERTSWRGAPGRSARQTHRKPRSRSRRGKRARNVRGRP
jgi:hypothetical protein